MPRAKNKEELLKSTNDQFNNLIALINSFSEEQKLGTFNFEDRDKNIRDVLIHLYEWHQLFLCWEKANKSGQEKSFLPEPYNWKTYPKMNLELWEKHQETSFKNAFGLLNKSHQDIINTINKYSDEELFTKKYFSWTGSTNLGSYCISVAPSHYDWAIKKIKLYKKEL